MPRLFTLDFSGAMVKLMMLQGDVNLALGKLIEAHSFYSEAALLAKKENESDDIQATIFIKVQSCLHAQGQNQEAIDNLTPLLSQLTLSLLVQGLLKRALGNVYRSAANWHLGERYLSEAVSVADSMGDMIKANEWKGELGRVYRSAGLHKKALELQYVAYEAALSRGDVARLANACGYIGFTNYSFSEPNCSEAIKYLCTRYLLSKNKLKDDEGIRWCLNNIGKVYLSMSNITTAIVCFKKSLELVQGTGNLLGEGTALGNLGSALRKARRYEEAIVCHNEYLRNAGLRLDAGGEAIMLYELAVDHILMEDFTNARDLALKAVVKLRSIHSSLSQEDDQLKIGNFEKNQAKTFNLLQYILSEMEQHNTSLLVSELGRARTLGDLMQRKVTTASQLALDVPEIIDGNACVDESLVNDICSHVMDIACKLKSTIVVYSLIDCSFLGDDKQQKVFIWVIPAFSRDLFFTKTLVQYERLANFQLNEEYLGGLRRDIGVYSQETFTHDADHYKRDIKFSKTKMVCSTSGDVVHHTYSTPHSSTDSSNRIRPIEQLIMLYNILIEPVVPWIPLECEGDPPRLIFIPHRVIFGVPFSALKKDDQYLTEKFILSQVPSLSILDHLVNLEGTSHSGAALVIGNPLMPHKEICQLPGSEEEAKTVQRIMGGKLLLNEDANKEIVFQEMPSYSIIHFATHATIADSIAEHLEGGSSEVEGDYTTKGAIVLSKSNATCSGILTSTEVQRLTLNCELMTLSCCRTACGTITGDGVLGLSRAVLLAGASCFVATLWAIEDESTSKLMEVFYDHYKQTRDAPKALRIALILLIKEERKIAHWASFCATGITPGMLT